MLAGMVDAGEHPTIVDLGAVHLEAAPGWRFYPMEDRVIGRPASGIGVIQLRRLSSDAEPAAASHELLMAAAIIASGFGLQGPGSDRAKDQFDHALAGGESFRAGADYVRVWYNHSPRGTVAAWFACPINRADERSVLQLIRDCDRMVASVRLPPPVS
jgi:hypothetical protein